MQLDDLAREVELRNAFSNLRRSHETFCCGHSRMFPHRRPSRAQDSIRERYSNAPTALRCSQPVALVDSTRTSATPGNVRPVGPPPNSIRGGAADSLTRWPL